ncbi:MAG TPA: tyrosine-protein phosphatase [Thermoanaerobaculia bacterium]|jgi:protein tyrosine phosphatase (PTP) superfamily phosphohydrolase (DUF442 family)|nr:tyrosine-protein phosphatase [Thermoanaerobaculia bacterium]
MKTRSAFFGFLVLSASLEAANPAPVTTSRPVTWAVPVEKTSVGNLYRVEDDLYRCAQPTPDGFHELSTLGVKTVLDLKGGADEVSGTPLKLFHVPMTAFGLRDDRVLEALKIMADPANRPIAVHCQHGADRTGALIALYRMVVQGWSKEDALAEMNDGGFHHSGLFRNLDRYVSRADVTSLRKSLGITAPGPSLAAVRTPLAAPAPATPASPAITGTEPEVVAAGAAK